MIKVDLNVELLSLSGTPIPEKENGHAGKILANALAGSTRGDSMKFWLWGTTLFNKGPLSLDKSDFDTLKEFIKGNESFTHLMKAQVLEVLNKAEKESENPGTSN